VIDGVIPELDDGHQAAAERLRDALLASLARLSGVPAELRRARRYERFRSFGAPDSVPTLERSGK
jgi:acetyl-CoA carboxylase alpha subunit